MTITVDWNLLPPVVVLATKALYIVARQPGCTTCAQLAAQLQHSLSYMEQVFGALKGAGLVVARKGPGGGYRLSRQAREITIGAIVDAFVDETRQALPLSSVRAA